MSKRAHSSNISPDKNKRAKIQRTGQPRIDSFFASPAKVKASATAIADDVVRHPFPDANKASKPSNAIPEIIDVDALESEEEKQSQPGKESRREASTRAPGTTSARISETDFSPLDIDPMHYDPVSQPSNSLHAPYSLLTHALVALSQTRSRIAIINILTNLLRTVISKHPSSLLPTVYLLSNSLGPQFISIELGLGSSIISHSIQQISGLSLAALKRMYNNTGDPGDVAFQAKSNIRTLIPHAPLTVPYVYQSLLRISQCKGSGAGKEKQKIVEKLLLAASGEEVRYLTRTLYQNLRVGAVRTSILTALARAFSLTPPSTIFENPSTPGDMTASNLETSASDSSSGRTSATPSKRKQSVKGREKLFKEAESLIKQVYVKHPSYDQIIPALLEYGLESLAERVPLVVGVPLLPMLGSPTRSLDEIYNRLGDLPFSAEFKYDGQRAQIHASRSSDGSPVMKIFSRHLEDMTSKYPDVIGLVNSIFFASEGLTSFIMDAEIVATDPNSGAIKPFQDLAGRARKDVNLKDVKVAVCVYAFDLMYLNEKSLLELTFRERRDLLRNGFVPRKAPQEDLSLAFFDFVENCESLEGRIFIEEFLLKAVEHRCEGLMIKLLDSPPIVPEDLEERKKRMKVLPATYEPDVRTSGWLKLKKDYIDSMSDSLDVIPVGAWHGNGRKAQWWSPILLALWNPETGRPVALCKCMSGFTDAFYTQMRDKYSPDSEYCSRQPIWDCDFGGFSPDFYFKPNEVWEIRGADITESPVSVAAHGIASSSRGLSLRFPRFIKTRDDKYIELASSPTFLVEIWKSQQGKEKNTAGKDEGELVDAEPEGSEFESSNESDMD